MAESNHRSMGYAHREESHAHITMRNQNNDPDDPDIEELRESQAAWQQKDSPNVSGAWMNSYAFIRRNERLAGPSLNEEESPK